MTRSLADIQSAFVDALKRPDVPVPQAIGKKRDRVAKRRFDVHRNNVAAGMIEALRATYPAIETLVGGDFFAASARVYVERHPPCSPLLFRYGANFGDFLDRFPPAASTPYLGDVARLEWARLKAYHAVDADPLVIESLSAFLQVENGDDADPGKLRFSLHPSLTLLSSRWPIVSLWAASAGLGASEDVDMAIGEHALIIRPMLTVETRALPESSYRFIGALADEAYLAEAAAVALQAVPDFDLAAHLQGLFALGAVCSINNKTT